MFCTGCTGKDTEPAQTAASVPAATEEGNRIITEGMLSPQIMPDEFTSKVLDEKSLQKLQKELGAETIYDCSYKAADDIYEISSVDSYDKSIIVFMKDGEKGWELKKESVLQVSFYMDGEFAGQPMQIFPAVHYTMGGIWVDYNLMTTIPGLYAIGEANFSDHGANRLGASALMQGLADGYFVLPYTIGDYLSHEIQSPKVKTDTKAFDEAEKGVKEKIAKLLAINGKQSVDDIHKKLGHIMWENVGMARTKESLEKAITEIQALRKEFWKDVKVVGKENDFNVELEKALRLADFLELGELMARDALNREESCGGHFRTEHQTEEGEAKRDDENFVYAAVWEYKGMDQAPELTKEPLNFEFVHPAQRNYKD